MLTLMISTFFGCNLFGGGACQTIADANESCGYETTDAEIEACEATIEPCTASDENKLVDYYECAAFCEEGETTDTKTTTGTDFTGFTEILACFEELEDVSPECLSALGLETTTDTPTTPTPTY